MKTTYQIRLFSIDARGRDYANVGYPAHDNLEDAMAEFNTLPPAKGQHPYFVVQKTVIDGTRWTATVVASQDAAA